MQEVSYGKSSNFCGCIASIGVHNGVVRIAFFRLLPDGRTEIVLELQIPQNQVRSLIEGLNKVRG
jgi:hypothetical protein